MDCFPRPPLTRLSVEFNLTEHCNLSCYACDHASPLLPRRFATVESFSKDVAALSRVFHSQQFRIVGGEPLLHPQLVDFLLELRRIKIADATVVITNGVLLDRVPAAFWTLIDELWVSRYPGVKLGLALDTCEATCRQHGVQLRLHDMGRFQRTLLNNRIENHDLIQTVFRECRMAGDYSCHTIYEGRFYKCSIAPFMEPRLALRGVTFLNRKIDGVTLHDNPNLYDEVERCLTSPTPLAACAYCLGTSAPYVRHHQLNHSGRLDWLREDHQADIDEATRRLLSRPATE
jgi:MoaA/NifB/PqqE/SkfB family radical SAM enzyme